MSFRLLRVKRRADQDPASSLYLPVEDENKRSRTETDEKEIRLFKIIERGNQKPTKIVTPTERQGESSSETKVILLSDSKDISTVAEAILIENDAFTQKRELSKLIKSEISDRFQSFNIQEDDEMNGEFVYDVYRLDLGRFTSKDIEGKANCVQIVSYEQEFLTDEEGTESEAYEDDDDSNAEDYFANDYPDEESQFSDDFLDGEHDDEFLDGELADEVFLDGELDDEFFLDQSVEIQEFDHDHGFDLDREDYEENDDFSFTDDSDDDVDEDGIYCYNEDE